jgi:hypothetical protein
VLVAAVRVLPIVTRGLGPGNQVNERPQVRTGNVNDVVALLAQRPGDRPIPVGSDVHEEDPHPEVLNLGDDAGQVFLGAGDDRIADRIVPGERGQVPVHLGLDAVMPARAHPGEPQLEPGDIGERVMLGGKPPLDRRLIPVAAQHRQASSLPRKAAEQLHQASVVPGD